MLRVIPSLASADPLALRNNIQRVDPAHLHLDVEDGNFVLNITFGLKTIRAVAQCTEARLDAHLMVTNPGDYIQPLAEAGVWALCAHYEAAAYPLDILNRIRRAGMRAGLALNFKTPAAAILPFASALDYVLIMTAEPDDNGQVFCPAMLPKIREARKRLPERVAVWVDGNIGQAEMSAVMEAGADTAIVGRAIWAQDEPGEAYRRLLDAGQSSHPTQ